MLNDKPELLMDLKQTLDPAKDLENLTFFQAKKRFYTETRKSPFPADSISKDDLVSINTMSVTDTAFLSYLNKKVNVTDPLVSTLEKCTSFLGAENLKNLQKANLDKRNRSIGNYLTTKLNLPPNRFSISTNTDATQVPEDKIPRYLISYTVPE
jgi:hypothetical protein